MEADGEAADVVLENTGDAVPVFVSFAISRAERVVCDVRLSLRRREKERLLAHREAESAMRSQLTRRSPASCSLDRQNPPPCDVSDSAA